MCLSLSSQKWNSCLALLFMGALPSQLFCFPTSPGHSFLTPDFSFSSVCFLRPCILAPWAFYTASSALPGCSCSSPACKLCWQDPGTLVALPLIKAALLSFSSSYGTGECPSGASQWCPPPSSQLLHHNFEVFLRKRCPGDYQSGCRGEGHGFIWALRPAFSRELWSGGVCGSCLPGYGAVAVGKRYCRYTPGCHRTLLRSFPMRHSSHITFSMTVPKKRGFSISSFTSWCLIFFFPFPTSEVVESTVFYTAQWLSSDVTVHCESFLSTVTLQPPYFPGKQAVIQKYMAEKLCAWWWLLRSRGLAGCSSNLQPSAVPWHRSKSP